MHDPNHPAPADDASASVVLPDYAELQCLSNYSFLKGASHPAELVERAARLGYRALALTDECSVSGVVRAHVKALELDLPFIVGSTFRLPAPLAGELIVLAQDRVGYGQLCSFITQARQRSTKGHYQVLLEDFQLTPAHPVNLPGCLAIVRPDAQASADDMAYLAQWLASAFAQRAWMGLALHLGVADDAYRFAVREAAQQARLPVTALGSAVMHTRSRKPLHDVLSAIRLGTPVAQCGHDLMANGERHLRPRGRLAHLHLADELAQTCVIAERCTFDLDSLRYEYPQEIVPAGMTPAAYLRQEALAGAQRRYPKGIPQSVTQQLEHELDLIASLQYEAYFLTVYDIVTYARAQGILCQGRGSAANSAVCFCLGITSVDPSRSNVLFERFLSQERAEPPDIDVDFAHQRREEVIQYLYTKYGRHRAALTAVIISYRSASAWRDVGRALGIDGPIVDAVTRQRRDARFAPMQDMLTQCGLDADSDTAQQWTALTALLTGFPRHLSQHPGGFVLSEGPLSQLVPIENAAMPDRSVVQWDKDDLDALGLLKVDVLALGMLTAIDRALILVGQRRGRTLAMHDIPEGDVATYDMICRADTVGVFQIESRAQMSMLPRLKPREYYDLVVQVAIVRPGPIQGGMVHPYLRRRRKEEPVTYPSAAVREVLERTLGVPIFQEQVMQLAMKAAGFSAGQADQLRRSMAAWRRDGNLEPHRARLVAGLLANGCSMAFADALFRQIEGFGEYGFPESHAASFALLAYISAWLKCHEPAAFLVALLDAQPMGFYSASQLVQDARRHGVRVLACDVSASQWQASLHITRQAPRGEVRLGFRQIRGLEERHAQQIEQAREQAPFQDIEDLGRRAHLDRRSLDLLARAGALASLNPARRQARWQAAAVPMQRDLLFDAPIVEPPAPVLAAPTEGETLLADYRSTGLTLGRHPLSLLRTRLTSLRYARSDALAQYPNRRLARACGIVTLRQRPQTASGTVFLSLEDERGIVNVIVHPSLIARQRNELLGASLLGVYGVWQRDEGACQLIARRLVDHSELLGELSIASRDFR